MAYKLERVRDIDPRVDVYLAHEVDARIAELEEALKQREDQLRIALDENRAIHASIFVCSNPACGAMFENDPHTCGVCGHHWVVYRKQSIPLGERDA